MRLTHSISILFIFYRFVQPGAKVSEFDPLVEVQSDKASVEITSRYSGTIKSLEYKEGEVAKVGSALCNIEMESEESETTNESATSAESQDQSEPSSSTTIEETKLEGFQNESSTSSKRSKDRTITSFKSTSDVNSPTLAVPAVRRLSKENGIDLNLINGSGKDGRVTKEDVLNFIEREKRGESSESLASTSTTSSSTTSSPTSTNNETQEVKLSSIRKAMFRSMTSSLKIPHFGYSHNLDLTNLTKVLNENLNRNIPLRYKDGNLTNKEEETLKRLGLERVPEDQRLKKLTMLSLLIKALDLSMREFPLFRSELNLPSTTEQENLSISEIPSKSTLKQHSNSIVSIALSTSSGLLTPTLPSINKLNPYQIASHMKSLQLKSSSSPLSSKDNQPEGIKGTVTLSNIGSIASGLFAMPIIPPTGQLAIAAIGRTQEIPTFLDQTQEWKNLNEKERLDKGLDGNQVVRRLVTGVSWSADHRVVEGAELAAFAERWKELVENPQSWLGLIA